jgi:hypothetical protein
VSDPLNSEVVIQGNPGRSVNGRLMNFLAGAFRAISFIFGTTAPSPEEDQRPFVFLWLGIIASFVVSAVLIFYVLWHVALP